MAYVCAAAAARIAIQVITLEIPNRRKLLLVINCKLGHDQFSAVFVQFIAPNPTQLNSTQLPVELS